MVVSSRVCVIGAGPSGLVAARECLQEGHRVRVLEKSDQVGGTWNVDPVTTELESMHVRTNGWKASAEAIHSSMYVALRTNIPREMMGFLDFPFTEFSGSQDTRRFPAWAEVRRYLDAFVSEFNLSRLIEFNSEVTRVEPSGRESEKWDVEVISNGRTTVFRFDAVVVASGMFSSPRFSEIRGIENSEILLLHSHLYRNPYPFANKRVVIHGAALTALDLGCEIGDVARAVYVCGRSWWPGMDRSKPTGTFSNVHLLDDIAECTGKHQLELTDGSSLTGIDVLLYCTGYKHSYPFLKPPGLISVGNRYVYPLYKYIFHAEYPTLAFAGALEAAAAFVMAEVQSRLIARVFSGRVRLPSFEDMLSDIDQSMQSTLKENGDLRTFGRLLDKQWPYMNKLLEMSGDVSSVPKWRHEMWDATNVRRYGCPSSFRDRPDTAACYEEAHQEFDALANARTSSAE